jgi:glutamate racemase
VHVLAERLLAPLVDADVDSLLLGCTHYPFLARTISDVMGREVVLVDSADATAFCVSDLLREANALRGDTDRGGVHRFESSGDVEAFRALGRQLLGPELDEVAPITWPEVTPS